MDIKALALISGGLDSTLAAKLVIEQGIVVEAVNFFSPFCLCNKRSRQGTCKYEAREVAEKLNIKLETISLAEDFLGIVKNPPHGYGKNMNPCIDCRILMLKKAKEFMAESGASFLITGEVVGQRPMSQHRNTLRLIEKESGLEGLILRPLSAKLLSETIPEKQGWINRERLLAFNGRSRKPQIALIKHFGIKDYPCAAGGCLLTDPGYSHRLKDLLKYSDLNLNETELLKIGRHFRLSPEAKLIVGRDRLENERLLNLVAGSDIYFNPQVKGPAAIGRGNFNPSLIEFAGRIISRYCDSNGSSLATIEVSRALTKEAQLIFSAPLQEDTVKNYLI